MSQENVEIVRRGMEEFNRQFNTEKLDLSLFAHDIVLDNSNAAFDGAVYRGHDGVREWLAWVREMWKHQQFKPQEFIPAGEDQVIVSVLLVSVGRDDVETVAHGAAVTAGRDGKLTQLK